MNDRFLAPAIHLMRELGGRGNAGLSAESDTPRIAQPAPDAVAIGRDMSAAGEIRTNGAVVLDGSFSGDIHCREAKITGRLTGNLRCRHAVLRGAAVIGDLTADVLDTDGDSKVFGTLKTGRTIRPEER